MKKKIICVVLALVMAAAVIPAMPHANADYEPQSVESRYFYNQLNDRAKAIYDKLLGEFSGQDTKSGYYDGTKVIDIVDVQKDGKKLITEEDIANYKNGNKDIFNDFCAAKDALDLDHSELWYIDSGYLTFSVTLDDQKAYHVLIGPGRGPTYLLAGQTKEDVEKLDTTIAEMDAAVDSAIDKIVDDAVKALNSNPELDEISKQDQIAYIVGHIHDSITKGIHYRYETECRDDGKYAKYIRTLYGFVSHEGVCEAYARTLQVCLSKLGIECVLVHGRQTKGTPEDHMWNAVNIPDDEGKKHWYVVDATWDDPLTANWDGTRDLEFKDGLDGKETNTYLLVGQSTVGEHWRPSGYVSTGNFEFTYPTIETAGYTGAEVFNSDNGLNVKYSTGASTEDNTPAGVYTVTFKGWNAAKAAENGFYFMLKMYDYHPDGTADVMDEWYYADASIALTGSNQYFGDYSEGLRFYTSTCEYVEVAVTTRKPYKIETWGNDPNENALSQDPSVGYFQGDESEIIAQSGMLYNVNSKYEAPPYVLTQFPAPNGNCTAGYNYRFKVTYDDDLKHPQANEPAAIDAFTDDTPIAANQTVRVRYTTIQQDLHTGGEKYVQIAGDLPFDTDRDGYVDMDKGNFKWIYKYEDKWGKCPNHEKHNGDTCDVNDGCAIVGVEFDFRASDLWIDDITEYNFSIEGVVGSRSNKFPNNFSVIAMVPGLCPACYRSQGIDWNLWGQPTLLDAPENLDLESLAVAEDSSDAAKKALDEFNRDIHRDDINGRLMLVVEDKSKGAGNREEYEKINDALPEEEKNAMANADEVFSSVFEINFNRVCPMVKLKPNKGQSLRVQVGYPAGITYEKLANYDLKAYHFVRCSNDPEYYCDEVKKELEEVKYEEFKPGVLKDHKWGEHIIKTEQITIIPTPYGMVIMCDAFSPFEIVAVKKSETAVAAASEETGGTLVVVSDGNGTVSLADGSGEEKAVGEAGNVKFADATETKTFKVTPKEGYTVESVILGGSDEPITVDGNNEFTVSGIKSNNVLNVTFVSTSAKEAEASFGDTVEVKACAHTNIVEVKEGEHQNNIAPTCTNPGYQLGTMCSDCKQIITVGKVIPAKGHTPATEDNGEDYYIAGTDATCEEGGKNALVKCMVCETVLSDGKEISALGHVFTDYEEGDKDCRGVELTATCDRCGDAVDTKVNPEGKVDHKFTKFTESKPATCLEDAEETAECDYGCGSIETRTKAGTAIGHHTPRADGSGVCDKCGVYICASKHTYVTTDRVEPTCTEAGHESGRYCSVCGYWETREVTIQPLGHEFKDHIAGTKCERCEQRLASDKHTYEAMPEKDATCNEDGSKGGLWCSQCNDIDPQNKPETVPALGHSWKEEGAKWNWSTEGDVVSASVTLTCKRDETHKETFKAEVQLDTETEPATCLKPGRATYTATATVEIGGEEKTLTANKEGAEIPMTKHTPGDNPVTTTPATCAHHGSKTYTCSICGQTVVEPIEGDLADHNFVPDHTKSVLPTCTASGTTVSVCAVCSEEKEETVPALGHSYENGVCSRCGSVLYIPPVPTAPTVPDEPEKEPVREYPVIREYEPFKDVPAGSWYEEDLKWSFQRGFISGDDNGEFRPEDGMNKGSFLVLLSKLDGVESQTGAKWMDNALEWAAKNLTDGSNTYGALIREEMITLLYNYFGCPEPEGSLEGFDDAGEVSPWCADAMRWAVGTGIVQGDGAGHLAPGKEATREEVAVLFAMFCHYCGIE